MSEYMSYNPEKESESKQEKLELDSYNIFYNQEIKEIFSKDDMNKKLSEITDLIDDTLGEKNDLKEKIDIHLFSNRVEYEDYLKQNFPDKFETYKKDNAIFNIDSTNGKKTIVNFKPSVTLSVEEKEKIAQHGMSEAEALKKRSVITRANILSSIAHEMTHLHPFFGGVGNDASDDLWEQENICSYIGDGVRIKEGNGNQISNDFIDARNELGNNTEINFEKDAKQWESHRYDVFLYPYLKNQYGMKKLQDLWKEIYKNKVDFSEAVDKIYGIDIKDLQDNFKTDLLAADNYKHYFHA